MAEYVFPAVFHPNTDGTFTITFPDLPGCISEGKSLGNAMSMAQDALAQWVEYLQSEKQTVPVASAPQSVTTAGEEFVTLIRADVRSNRAVRRTVSIPQWMDEQVSAAGLSLSRVLQDALKDRLDAV